LGYIALVNLDRVSVNVFSSRLEHNFPLSRGKQSAWRLFEFLQNVPCGQETDLFQSCRSFALRFKKSSVVIVLSDFLDIGGYENGLRFLSGSGRDVFVFHILSPEEANPVLTGDIRLTDCETSQQVDLSVSDALLGKYQNILRGYIQDIGQWCTRHDMSYLYTSTQQSFEDLVLKYLRSMGMLK